MGNLLHMSLIGADARSHIEYHYLTSNMIEALLSCPCGEEAFTPEAGYYIKEPPEIQRLDLHMRINKYHES